MRKNILAKSIATLISGLALVGGAHAAVLIPSPVTGVNTADQIQTNTDGIGHQLFVPYYTVQGDNVSLFSLVNTDTMNGKAVKVRFRGAQNSDDVYDITVLMSPGDVWNASITRGADGIARLDTADKTCTLPANVNQPFVTARLPGTDAAAKAAETREGYIEIFNMADIPPSAVAGSLFLSIKHSNGVPANCNSAAVNALFTNPADTAAAEAMGLGGTTTGLTANWTIYNGPQAVSWAGAAVATEARDTATNLPGYGNIVFFPQSAVPVPIANVRTFTSDPILRGGVADNSLAASGIPGAAPVAAAMFDFPDMSTPYLTTDVGSLANGVATRRQAYRMSRALAVSSVMNEYITVAALAARTDWTFSSPTRRYNVARNYAAGSTLYTNFSLDDANGAMGAIAVPGVPASVNPDNYFEPATTGGNISADANGVLCVGGITFAAGATSPVPENLIGATTADQEERFTASSSDFVISPGTPAVAQRLCGEVSVLSFNAGLSQPSVLGASLTRLDLTSAFSAGWLRIATPGLTPATANEGLGGSDRQGLPLVGHAVTQFTNNNALAGGSAAGTIGNYDQTLRHRNTRY